MSVDTYNFKCPKCGHTEQQSEGLYLFSDECYTMLQCPQCHKVCSEKLTEAQANVNQYPKCAECGVELVKWNKNCPDCNAPMEVSSWYSDTI